MQLSYKFLQIFPISTHDVKNPFYIHKESINTRHRSYYDLGNKANSCSTNTQNELAMKSTMIYEDHPRIVINNHLKIDHSLLLPMFCIKSKLIIKHLAQLESASLIIRSSIYTQPNYYIH